MTILCSRDRRDGTNDADDELKYAVDRYVDGLLGESEKTDLFEHLATCDECRYRLDAILDLRRFIQDERFEVPAWTDRKLFARVDAIRSTNLRHAKTKDFRMNRLDRARLVARAVVFTVGAIAAVSIVGKWNADGITSGAVVGSQEMVDFNPVAKVSDPVYVFYPGLVIEESR